MLNLNFAPQAWEDYLYWQTTDKKTLKRVNELIKDTCRTPFIGIGKPEPLKGEYSTMWSRRINQEDRMIYQVTADTLNILQLRYHY